MVEKVNAWETKFGTLAKTEEKAKNIEEKEKEEDFIIKSFELIGNVCMGDVRKLVLHNIYENREEFKKLLDKY